MLQHTITVKDVREAIKGLPDETNIEISVGGYSAIHAAYIHLKLDSNKSITFKGPFIAINLLEKLNKRESEK